MGASVPPQPQPQPQLTQDDSALAALKRELLAWHQRGGKVDPGQVIGGEIKMPGGLYGGEFSPEEMRAYNSAGQQLGQMQAANANEHRVNNAANSAYGKASAPSDATAVLVKALLNRK